MKNDMYDLLIKNAFVVEPENISVQDVLINKGTIVAIKKHIDEEAQEILQAAGLYLMPGCIDPHVHLRTPGATHKEDITTGTKAAIKGGYTVVFDMPNTTPSTITQQAYQEKKAIGKEMSYCHIGFHFGVVPNNVKTLSTEGVKTVKMYMGASTGDLLVDDISLQEAMFKNAGDITIFVHAEDESLIQEAKEFYKEQNDPEIHSCIRHTGCAVKAVETALSFAKKYNTKLHVCHISTKEELDLIQQAKREGVPVTCEVGPHHLYLTYDHYSILGNRIKMNPPVRSEADTQSMWEGLADGSIDCIGSDHAPHTKEEKDQSYWSAPSGVPELDTTLQLLLLAVHEKKLTLLDCVRIMAENPAHILGLEKRGTIKEGNIADLILVDLEKPWIINDQSLETKCGWTPYEGWEGKGMNMLTILAGEIVYDSGFFHQGVRREVFE